MRAGKFAEWPLVFFTLFSQLAAGLFLAWGIAAVFLPEANSFQEVLFSRVVLTTVLAALIIGGGSAAAHLGKIPHGMYSLTNWRKSWLSREALLAVGFGLFSAAALMLSWFLPVSSLLFSLVILTGCLMGIGLVWGISKLYRLRTVPAWNHPGTPASFYLTSLLTGSTAFMIIWFILRGEYHLEAISGRLPELSGFLLAGLTGLQLIVFLSTIIFLSRQGGAGAASVRLLGSSLLREVIVRWMTASAAVGFLIWSNGPVLYVVGYGLLIVSEVLGRYLFYAFYRRSGL